MFKSLGKGGIAFLGDCLEILPTIENESVDMVFMDPPYGINVNDGDLISNHEIVLGRTNNGPKRPIANDGDEANEILAAVLPQLKRILKPDGSICCCCSGGGGPDPIFARWSLMLDEVFNFKQMIVWDKGPIGMGWHYRRSYETILVAEKGKPRWFAERNDIENIIRPGDYGIRKIIPSEDHHPTPKPPELAAHFISLHTREGDTILDPFMGAGSTGIAAAKTKRKFIGIELEKKWFDMACKDIRNEASQMTLF